VLFKRSLLTTNACFDVELGRTHEEGVRNSVDWDCVRVNWGRLVCVDHLLDALWTASLGGAG
jgi:hypothetical protein